MDYESRVFWLKLLQTFPQDNTNSHFQKQYVLFGYSLHTYLIYGSTNSQQVKKVMFYKREQITQCSLHHSYNTGAYLAIHL